MPTKLVTAALALVATLATYALPCGADAPSPSPIPQGFTVKEGQQLPADWSARESAGFTIINPTDGAEVCWIPPGEFSMGSTRTEQIWSLRNGAGAKWVDTEDPQHKVRISGFWMYKYEVTNRQYRLFKPDHHSGACDTETVNDDDMPVAWVNWYHVDAYCKWAGVRLPSEAQWEYACRAGTATMFWWGESLLDAGKYANMADRTALRVWPDWSVFPTDDGYAAASPVGSFAPNPFGLYDILGNAWEWCNDWYSGLYYRGSPELDPPGPQYGSEKIVRGASWDNFPANARCAYRLRYTRDTRAVYLGFRAAVPAAIPVPPN